MSLLKDNKTKDCVKLIIVLSRNKTRYIKRGFFFYNPPAYTWKMLQVHFHHRENSWERKKFDLISVVIENAFSSLVLMNSKEKV